MAAGTANLKVKAVSGRHGQSMSRYLLCGVSDIFSLISLSNWCQQSCLCVECDRKCCRPSLMQAFYAFLLFFSFMERKLFPLIQKEKERTMPISIHPKDNDLYLQCRPLHFYLKVTCSLSCFAERCFNIIQSLPGLGFVWKPCLQPNLCFNKAQKTSVTVYKYIIL